MVSELSRLSEGAIFGTHFYAKGPPELISQGMKEMGRDEAMMKNMRSGIMESGRNFQNGKPPPREGSRAEPLPAAWPVPPRPKYPNSYPRRPRNLLICGSIPGSMLAPFLLQFGVPWASPAV